MRLTMRVVVGIFVLAAGVRTMGAQTGQVTQSTRALEAELRAAQYREAVHGDVEGAMAVYRKLAGVSDRGVAAKAALALEEARRKVEGSAQGRTGSTQKALIAGEEANELWGFVSPDGRYLPFQHPQTGNVAVRDLRTGKTALVTSAKGYDEGWVEYIVWSPDGKQLAYSWWDTTAERGSTMELRVIARERGTPRVVHRMGADGWLQPYGWSPDGKTILVDYKGGNGGSLALINLADGAVRPLKTQHQAGTAMFSPDGRYVAYEYSAAGVTMRDINIVGVDGTGERALVTSPDHDYLLGWFPNGKHLLFASDRLNAPGAWAQAVENGAPQGAPFLVRADIGRTFSLGFDNDGRFHSTLSVAGGDVFIAEIDPATGKVTQQSRPAPKPVHLARRSQGAWSRDGQKLAYFQHIEGRGSSLVVQTIATGAVVSWPLPVVNLERPAWFPDGNAIAIEANAPEGGRAIFKVDVRSGTVTQLERPVTAFCCLSPDGESMFFLRGGQGHFRKSLKDGAEQNLRKGPGAIVLSPDGSTLAIWQGNQGKGALISVLPASGGEPRVLINGVPGSHNKHAWSADGRHVFYIANRNQLWRVPVAGGAGVDTGVRVEIAKNISVHPDGRRLALSGGAAQAEVWVWENLLPKK